MPRATFMQNQLMPLERVPPLNPQLQLLPDVLKLMGSCAFYGSAPPFRVNIAEIIRLHDAAKPNPHIMMKKLHLRPA